MTGFIPQLMTIGHDLGSLHTIHHNTSVIGQDGQHLFNDLLQLSAMTTNEDGIGTRYRCNICFQEVADVHIDARGAEATSILMDDCFTFRTNLECLNLKVRKLQTCFDGNAACAETDVPKGVAMGQIKGLKGELTDGHLGDHLFPAIKKHKFFVWDSEPRFFFRTRITRIARIKNDTIWH